MVLSSLTNANTSLAAVDTAVGVVTSGLRMYFDPANPSGFVSSTVLKDLSGNGFNGTLTKTGAWPDVQTGQGRYLGFDGAGGYIDLPDITSPSNWSGLTFTFYANFGGGANNFERIFDFGNGAASNNIIVGREGTSGNIFIEIYRDASSGGYCRSTTNSIGVGTWDYWAITMNGSTCTIYKNNVVNASQAYTYLPWARTLANNYIGKSNWADAAFEGGISDLAIYDRALSTTELTQNYNAGVDIAPPTISPTMLSSPENSLSVTTLSTGETSYYTLLSTGDYARVSLTSSGVLSFVSNPNYEAPADLDSNNQYGFDVRVADANGNYTDTYVQITVTNVAEYASLSAPTLSANPYKGIAVTITITPTAGNTAGKITYLVNGKRIPGCYKKTYTGTGSATCLWEPTTRGNRELSITFTPNGSEYAPATVKKTFFIYNRTTTR
jgi:hypothetical protein